MSSSSQPAGVLPRSLLVLSVVITATGFLGLLVVLGFYFASVTPPAALYWVVMWGLPIGFALLVLQVMLSIMRRRRARYHPA